MAAGSISEGCERHLVSAEGTAAVRQERGNIRPRASPPPAELHVRSPQRDAAQRGHAHTEMKTRHESWRNREEPGRTGRNREDPAARARSLSGLVLLHHEEGVQDNLVAPVDCGRDWCLAAGLRHREFTRLPHLAGTEQNLRYAEQIGDEWLEFGLDSVELVPYDVLLSYPNQSQPNYIAIVDRSGSEVFNTSLAEPVPEGYEHVSDIVPPYSAFSAKGQPEGDLVYVNYGRTEDFSQLEAEMGVNATGKIVIVRYGKIFRGNKKM
ncbi:Glutamate carboxypeptidase 2 [Liparis tanakae]|uniref:Glutamate carboxypeptidase 2 n=1 Tax=Liparis tanakae TaxID=230148 RepID=A0A4Z2G4E2_9TELE|nr:Glutamate carboxypeptidase 2 [Liparis tanakae]